VHNIFSISELGSIVKKALIESSVSEAVTAGMKICWLKLSKSSVIVINSSSTSAFMNIEKSDSGQT